MNLKSYSYSTFRNVEGVMYTNVGKLKHRKEIQHYINALEYNTTLFILAKNTDKKEIKRIYNILKNEFCYDIVERVKNRIYIFENKDI